MVDRYWFLARFVCKEDFDLNLEFTPACFRELEGRLVDVCQKPYTPSATQTDELVMED